MAHPKEERYKSKYVPCTRASLSLFIGNHSLKEYTCQDRDLSNVFRFVSPQQKGVTLSARLFLEFQAFFSSLLTP